MDKKIKEFAAVSAVIVVFFVTILAIFIYIYRNYDINVYKNVTVVLILLTVAGAALFTSFIGALFYTYHKKRIRVGMIGFVKLGMNLLFPVAEVVTGIIGSNKDYIRDFYITINNIIVRSEGRKYTPDEVLVLLPHCLQNAECRHKVTNDIANCTKCGRCCVGDFVRVAEEKSLNIRVATGGTAARNIIAKSRPKLILSVACERDLASGISDVRKIPVIGVINERPHGPCYNTNINIEEFKNILNGIVDDPQNKNVGKPRNAKN